MMRESGLQLIQFLLLLCFNKLKGMAMMERQWQRSAAAAVVVVVVLVATLLVAAVPISIASSAFSLPAMVISNWKDSVLTWASARDCENPNVPPVRVPGVTSWRFSVDWSKSALQQDSFAVRFNNGQLYGDPKQWSGTDGAGVVIGGPSTSSNATSSNAISSALGVYTSTYNRYSSANLPFSINRTIIFPPQENFYIVTYTITNSGGSSASIDLLDYVTSDGNGNRNCANAYVNPSISEPLQLFSADLSGCGANLQLGVGAFQPYSSYMVGSADGQWSPLQEFSVSSTLTNGTNFQWNFISIGTSTHLSLGAGQSAQISFFRILRTNNQQDVIDVYRRIFGVNGDPLAAWCNTNVQSYAQFLNRGKVSLNTMDDLYRNALITTKNSQNPTRGTFMASFHSLYGFKVWTRDAVFSAMIMDVAGYHEEARAFLEWLSLPQTELRPDDGAFHTCYNSWTGNAVGFVEPQFDGDGAFLMGVYLHYLMTRDTTFAAHVFSRVRQIEQFFLKSVGVHGFVSPDYSIWEESSDPHSGASLSTSYFTFSQSMSFAGLYAAAQFENIVPNGDAQIASQLLQRASQVMNAVQQYLWVNTSDGGGYFARSMTSDTLKLDTRADSSSVATIFTGLTAASDPTYNGRADSHLNVINTRLSHNWGVSRYEQDPFFYDSIYNPCKNANDPTGREVGAAAPPWGVTTMFTAWAELQLSHQSPKRGSKLMQNVQNRLSWMADHSARGGGPVGECVDGVSGNFVWASAPDLYEHGGVYVWTWLQSRGLAWPPNPILWKN